MSSQQYIQDILRIEITDRKIHQINKYVYKYVRIEHRTYIIYLKRADRRD